MLIGYMRVSKEEGQSLDLQEDALRKAGCAKLFSDMASGKTTAGRTGLKALLEHVRDGDEVIVWRIDRLARNTLEFLTMAEDLGKRGVALKSLNEPFEFSGPIGRFFATNLACIAELERSIIAERTKAGLAAAKKRGAALGRPRALKAPQREHIVTEILAGRMSHSEAARLFKVSKRTIDRLLEPKAAEAMS